MKDFQNPPRFFRPGLTILLLTSVLMSSTVIAKGKPKQSNRFAIGLGVAQSTNVFKGLDDNIDPAVLLDVRLGGFFARRMYSFDQELTIGYDLFENDSVTLALAASMGGNNLEVKNQQLHLGIQDRDAANEAGFVFRYYSRIGLLEANYFQDISDTHDGVHGQIKISNPLPGHGKLDIVPGFFFTYYGAKYNRYYYGVTREENELGNSLYLDDDGNNITTLEQFEGFRPVYTPGNSIHAGVDVYLQYNFSKNLYASGYIAYEDFTGEVEGSPLVEDKSAITTLIGLNYQF